MLIRNYTLVYGSLFGTAIIMAVADLFFREKYLSRYSSISVLEASLAGYFTEMHPLSDEDLNTLVTLKQSVSPWVLRNGTRFATRPRDSSTPVPILLLPQIKLNEHKANTRHLIYDGVLQSPLLEFTENQTDDRAVWLVDFLSARQKWSYDAWCDALEKLVNETQLVRKTKGLATKWPIRIVDNRDYAVLTHCSLLPHLVGNENILYSFRALIEDRAWKNQEAWVSIGTRIAVEGQVPAAKHEYRQRPIGVRTDIVGTVESVLQEHGSRLCDDTERLDRPVDVSYFWESSNYTRDDAHLRDRVFEILVQLERASNWKMQIGIQGETAATGRKEASDSYVRAMLDSKIVVVAQRDKWEDHYRLFEAIVAGALVLTDKMLSLPKGLKDGESVAEYESEEDLLSKIEYYLRHPEERIKVAKRGRFIAMSRHRSWQHMEELIFGAPVTVCGDHTGSRCPYIVEANQLHEEC